MTDTRIDPESHPNPARLLEAALIATFVCHGVAMLSMALLLLPTMPGGGTASDLARVTAIAEHPWRFRLGWLPWHLTAISDLLLAVAMLRTRWIPRLPAWIVLLVTCAAVVADQGAQLLWITRGVDLAREAVRSGDLGEYMSFERWVFPLTGAWAALLYSIGAIAWSWTFAAAGTWSRTLTWLSVVTWGTFLFVSIGPLLPAVIRPAPEIVAAGNAVGFLLMEVWFVLVAEQVMRRARPSTAHGRWAPWRHPRGGAIGSSLEVVANSRFARALCAALPSLEFRSDITDVIYVNYLVDADRLAAWLPDGLELQRLGPGGRYALFTFLTYRHGHFGPAIAGPLRRLFSSPVQSNWRTYVRDPRTGHEGIYFVSNGVTTALHSAGARLMAEGMSMHLLHDAEVSRDASDGSMRLRLDPGAGSAPDAAFELTPSADRQLPSPWSECFTDYDAMLRYTVPQDRAMCTQPWRRRTTRQEIALGIPVEVCEPLVAKGHSRAAAAIVGEAAPLCFRVPTVTFRFTHERYDAWDCLTPRS